MTARFDPQPSAPLSDVAAFPARLSRLVAWGPVIGLVTGTVSYFLQIWLSPGFEFQPQGMFVWVAGYNVLVWTVWLMLLPVKWWLAALVPITAGRRALALAFHAVAGLVVSVGNCALDAAMKYAVLSMAGQGQIFGRPLTFVPVFTWMLLYSFEWQVLLYWGIVAAYHAIAASRTLEERRLGEARLETDLVEARLEALQRQLNPHFFFNALNAVSTLIHRDTRQAESMLVRLGDLLRAVFRSQVQQEVPLARELALLDAYLDIQRVRFGGQLRVEVDVPAPAQNVLVPVLVLQPLAENAIKHGFAGRPEGGTIRIVARRVDDRLELTVADDGRGRAGTSTLSEGVGLSNTRSRLAHLYPRAHALEISSQPGGGFTVKLSLPWQTGSTDTVDALDIPA